MPAERCPRADLPGDERCLLSLHCPECTAQAMRSMTLEQVENWWRQGLITTAALYGYRHVWATMAVRFGQYGPWTRPPSTEESQRVAAELRRRRVVRPA
jgi:hypothetical protein